jgi:hypothetical protein
MQLGLETEPNFNEDWKTQYPFLVDYELGDFFKIENASFHISSKCYVITHKLRRRPEVSYALTFLDPEQWTYHSHYTFYDKLVDIDVRIEFLKSIRSKVLCWLKDNNNLSLGPFWWMENINVAANTQIFQWDGFIARWKQKRDNLISIQQKKRILEFFEILQSVFESYNFNEPILLFEIIQNIFDFHPDNKRCLFLKRKLIN